MFCSDGNFFWRRCSATGKRIYSAFPEQCRFPVVALDYWQSTDWDPLSFGLAFSFKRSFFEQLQDLWNKVPRPAHVAEDAVASSVYHHAWGIRHSYMVAGVQDARAVLYGIGVLESEQCIDCTQISACHTCYECVHCYSCKSLRFAECCLNCEQCSFISHCEDCRNCLFCTGLQGKEHYVFNQPLSPEGYRRTLQEWSFSARQRLEAAKDVYNEFISDKPIPHIFSDAPHGNSGNYLVRCLDAIESFECVDCRDCRYLSGASDALDGCGAIGPLSHGAQFVSVSRNASNIRNCVDCWNDVQNLDYCSFCENCANLFGCVGLRGKEYCILNRQLDNPTYAAERERIIDHLKRRGVWGKFFPVVFSGFAYNRSAAHIHMPLGRIPAQMMGFEWEEVDDFVRPSALLSGGESAPEECFSEVPGQIEELTDSAVRNSVYLCEISGRPFRFTREEVDFYRQIGVAPPVRGPDRRLAERIMGISPKYLNLRKESGGSAELHTAYPATWRRPVIAYDAWRANALP